MAAAPCRAVAGPGVAEHVRVRACEASLHRRPREAAPKLGRGTDAGARAKLRIGHMLLPGNLIKRASAGDIQQRVGSRVAAASAADDAIAAVDEATDAADDAASKLGQAAETELDPNADLNTWNKTTERLVGGSTLGFMLLLLPQIFKNVENLAAGNTSALAVLPWIGYSTGLAANLMLLSYFIGKDERSATLVQSIGAISGYAVITQIYLAGYMPPAAYYGVTVGLVLALVVNVLKQVKLLPISVWRVWQNFIGVGGVTLLPQVLWVTFTGYNTPVPAIIAAISGRLPNNLAAFWRSISAWTATLLFMFTPIPQLQACFANPASVQGISILTTLLGIASNALMVPRALFTRDLMWFTGTTWGTTVTGWGILCAIYLGGATSPATFWTSTALLASYFITVLVLDAKSYSLSNPILSLKGLLRGSS
eukprot:SM000117S25478  [mRNA]  locus=s117:61601:64802:- [translate_table: standard]